MLRKVPLAMVLVALFAAGLVLGAACGSDDDDGAEAQDADIVATQEQAEKAMLLAALTGIDAIALHEIDDNLQTASAIPDTVSADIERAGQIAAGTEWPDELAELGADLETALADFSAAIEADDLEAAKTQSAATHAAYHDLTQAGYAFYAGEEGHAGGDHGTNATHTPGS